MGLEERSALGGAKFLFCTFLATFAIALAPARASQARASADELKELKRELRQLEQRIEKLEKSQAKTEAEASKIEVLASELSRLRTTILLPKGKRYRSIHEFGPAASKIYQIEKGLSIGGYGELRYRNFLAGRREDRFDLKRFVLYTGYKFTDRLLLNSEIEFEDGTTEETPSSEGGEVSVEFLTVDYFLRRELNLRAGLILMPIGFLNLIHEPPFFHGNLRPEVETRIIPTTWSEGGFGFFGRLPFGLEYQAYLVNGLNAKGFSSEEGVREGRQKGSRAIANDLAGTFRLTWNPAPGLGLGGSVFAGNAGQGRVFAGKKPDVFTLLWELHGRLSYRGLELKTLGAFVDISDASVVSEDLGETIAKNMFGYYVEAAYDVVPILRPDSSWYAAPFFRLELVDTQDDVPRGFPRAKAADFKLFTSGLTLKPHPQVVFKADYRNFLVRGPGRIPDEFDLGVGFAF